MSLNSKLADPAQNSYCTATQADLYFQTKVDSENWNSLSTTASKENVLIEAARMMEFFNYKESKYYDTQGLSFPFASHETVTGNCATPTVINSFKHSDLYSTTYGEYPQNFWKFGSVHIVAGTPLNDIRLIATSNETTGSIVVTENFSTTCNATTEFIVFAPIQDEIRFAQCEQALYLLDTNQLKQAKLYSDIGAKYIRLGDAAVSYHENVMGKMLISPIAKKLLSAFINKNLKVARS